MHNMNTTSLNSAIDELAGYVTVIATSLSSTFKDLSFLYHEETPWREFVEFLEDHRVQLVIKNHKGFFLKVRLFYRKLLPANKVLFIKCKRNKK